MSQEFDYERALNFSTRKIKSLCSSLATGVTKPGNSINVNEVKVDFEELTSVYESFKADNRRQFNELDEESSESQTKAEDKLMLELETLSKLYRTAAAKAKTYISEYESLHRDPNASINLNSSTYGGGVKHPKIEIPEFDGRADKFLEFAAIFENLVHLEPDIPKVKKLVLLKNACKENSKPRELIENMPLTECGYDAAWKTLNNTYRNMRRIIRTHFDDLFSIKRIQNSSGVTELYTKVTKSLKGLEACNVPVSDFSIMISYIVSERLDEQTYEDFEKTLTTNDTFPSWELLGTFLETRCNIIKRKSDSKSESKPSDKPSSSTSPKKQIKRTATLATQSSSSPASKSGFSGKPKCVVCAQFHLLIDCDIFKAKSPAERYLAIKSKPMCKNCFNSNHATKDCHKASSCDKCAKKHHKMLHFGDKEDASPETQPETKSESKSSEENSSSAACIAQPIASSSNSSLTVTSKPIVLLPTAVVKFRAGNKSGEMRVLLDSCSQMNLITQSFVNRFKLQTSENRFVQKITGVNDTEQVCNKVVSLSIESRTQPFKYDASFNVISTKLPYTVYNVEPAQLAVDLTNYKLADPVYYESTINIPQIDALLGIQAYDRIVGGSVLRIGSAYLRDTKFGWTLTSTIYPKSIKKPKPDPDASLCCLTLDRIDERLKLFWETEEAVPVKSESTEAELCNSHFEKTYSRNENGQFVVRLPFKSDPKVITGNYDRVLAYQNRVHKRLTPETVVLYEAFMKEYAELGHMTVIPNAEKSGRYFIPHHAVLKPSSTTTKLRAVFHASFGTTSLNDVLMVGPVVQPELFDVLLRFRTWEYVVSVDVAKFYRCVWVHPDDRIYQSIIWKNLIHELNTVTYGTGPASYQATKCLLVLANEIEPNDPVIAFILRHCFYMDDGMFGADNVNELIRICKVLHRVLAKAGFHLRKYQSNSPEVLKAIDPKLVETELTKRIGGNDSLSVLGLSWAPAVDIFQPKADITDNLNTVTKRTMLSCVAKIYDPLGLAAPVVIRGKLQLQRIWKLGLDWDTPVPEELAIQFKSYVTDLIELKRYQCPRYSGANESTRLIGFADASEVAYCAVIYVLTVHDGQLQSELYCSKTRVAPVKSLTVPQLELQAAALLTELLNRVRRTLIVPNERVYLFSDSEIVLSWLNRPPTDWKIFVRNRVAKIVASYPANMWNHVSTKQNPADVATRGVSTDKLINSSLWSHGPEFLRNETITRPDFKIDDRCLLYLSKPKAVICLTTEPEQLKLIESISSYSKLLRTYATAKVIARKLRTKSSEPINVGAADLEFAESYVIRIVQQCNFSDDFQRLTDKRKLCKRSKLRSLTPFIDDNGVIRSRSRLQNANVSFQRKCPIILPSKSHFVTIMIRYLHEKYFHVNKSFLAAHLSAKFVFVGGCNRIIKKVIYQCVTCRRHFATTKPQLMADLPSDRVNPRSPFEVTGVDFTGAFTIRCNHHRVTKYAKVYACIFVCMVTRAVHIEVVPSLLTEDFLNALKMFTSRRGLPSTIYSDNGTNFRCADRYLNLKDDDISRYAVDNRIQWNFNPPYTPHRGGVWEAAVKSAKRFLPVVTKDQVFSENELRVFLTQVECLLNSRPLAYRKCSEPTEEVLTPGHFLVGRNLTTIAEPMSSGTVKISENYRANRRRINDFWRLWSTDYINQLRCRSKWLTVEPNPIPGQIVLFKEPNTSPSKWPLARVERCFPDPSGVVRTMEISVGGELKKIPTIHSILLPSDT